MSAWYNPAEDEEEEDEENFLLDDDDAENGAEHDTVAELETAAELKKDLVNVCQLRVKGDNVLKRVKLWMSRSRAERSERAGVVGENFFEQFLDGSAGVMYTSFLGLIIDELLTYGDSDKK